MRKRDRFLDRKTAAELVTGEYFPASKRSLERWPIVGKLIHGRVHLPESAVRAYAQRMLDDAPATPAPKLRKDR